MTSLQIALATINKWRKQANNHDDPDEEFCDEWVIFAEDIPS